ncbi:MAG TPA: redoxin domain-containing protein [Anaerolineales bacterium]|nr:redoxin domain-containing protein [Anaerolineales bacterium]
MRAGSSQWTLNSLGILLLGAAWIWASAVPAGSQNGRLPAPQAGFQAPDFRLPTPSGETISLADLRGQPVLINLWASWCPPCREEMPAIQRVYQDYQSRGFVVLAVNATSQDSLPSALEFVSELGLTFPILLDTDGQVSALYRLRSLPTSFFVDGKGIIREVVIGGPMSEALLRIRVEQLFELGD